MGEIARIYNNPIEIAIRILMILSYSPNQSCSLSKLMILDHLSLNTFDIGGPVSLHAPIPNRGIQVYSRKEIMDKSIKLLIAKKLVIFITSLEGFSYQINDNGKEYLKYFESKYFTLLFERVRWVCEEFGSKPEKDLNSFVNKNLKKWGEEFMADENQFENL